MASVLFISWWGGGNMTPVLALSAAMRERGHEAAVLGPKQYAPRLALDNVGHVRCQGWTPTTDEAFDAVKTVQPDLVVVDFMMAEVLAVASTLGPRTAALVHTLWQPVADRVWDSIVTFTSLERVNEIRAGRGLGPVDHAVELLHDLDVVLVSVPEPLDWPVETEWPNALYLGPTLEPAGPDEGWEPPGGEGPLVAVNLGTTPMGEERALAQVHSAASRIPDVRFIVTVGDHLDPAGFNHAPNTVLSGYVRHAALLPHASVVVSHAGLGTTIAAASHGLPMVCLPLGRDQFNNARRVEELGFGVAIDSGTPPREIAEVIGRTLDDVALRAAAQHLAAEIAAAHPSPADAFEALLV
jgi:hypothetical protein